METPCTRLLEVWLAILVAACSGSSGRPAGGDGRSDSRGLPDTTRTSKPNQVSLSEAGYTVANILVAAVEAEKGGRGFLETPGHVELDSTRLAVVSSRAPGRIERLLAGPGQRVGRGAIVAVLTSPVFLAAQSDFLQANRRAAALARTEDAEGANALAAAARHRLLLLGADEGTISRLTEGAEPSLTLGIPAPFDGSLLGVEALPGTTVEPGTPIMTMVDLSSMNVIADIPERSIAAIRPGIRATILVSAYPEVTFAGRVARMKAELDPTTRALPVVIAVANPGDRLKAGMFATVRIDAGRGPASDTIAIPEGAVVTDGEMRYVFVQVDRRTFERRTIELAPPGSGTPGKVMVRAGLAPGERVVIRGAFVLKSELAKTGFAEPEG